MRASSIGGWRAARSRGCSADCTVGIKDVTPVAGAADDVRFADLRRPRARRRRAGRPTAARTRARSSSARPTVPEFAAGGNTFNEVFGRTRNPWDPTQERRRLDRRRRRGARHRHDRARRRHRSRRLAPHSRRRSAASSVCVRRSASCRPIRPTGCGTRCR